MKILSVVGARPQFVKMAPVSRMLRAAGHHEVLVHTGQHYDDVVSDVFFRELDIPQPDVNLGVGSGPHGRQTGDIIVRLEPIVEQHEPDWVVVYGDTNSTLAGALAAAKLGIRIAHVEAGLRSFNRQMPEEINRVVVDHLSDLLLCPSQTAVDNLASEGITSGVHLIGDVMMEALADASERAAARSGLLKRLELVERGYLLATIHRAENTDQTANLLEILRALELLGEPVVFPVHPRTRKTIDALAWTAPSNVRLIEPVGYLDMVTLERGARLILTDSGGIQKEAYWLGVPCITLRTETEWVETVEAGWNVIAGAGPGRIVQVARSFAPPRARPPLYGDGQAAARCVALLKDGLNGAPLGRRDEARP